VHINVTVNTPTLVTVTNNAVVSASTPDLNLGNNQAVNIPTTVDPILPTVTWDLPVGNGGTFHVGCEVVGLRAIPSDNLAIQRVRFYRWDHVNLVYVNIGSDDTTPPYQRNIDTCTLLPSYNQIFVKSYDTAGNESERKRILLFRYTDLEFLPIVAK
jgi:hypothetical protein